MALFGRQQGVSRNPRTIRPVDTLAEPREERAAEETSFLAAGLAERPISVIVCKQRPQRGAQSLVLSQQRRHILTGVCNLLVRHGASFIGAIVPGGCGVSVTVTLIIPTLNRPRMLGEALASVARARPDEVIVCDDGSDVCNVATIAARELGPHICHWTISNVPISAESRMTTPRQGRLLNQALAMVTSDVTTLLCDDDLLHPGWLDALRAAWARDPGREIVRGDWLQFSDGDTPSEADPFCPLDRALNMTAGNFAWHTSLTRDRGLRFDETVYNCFDAYFLNELRRAKVDVFRAPTVGLAGWRREHPLANGNWSENGNRHSPQYLDVLRGGYLEAVK